LVESPGLSAKYVSAKYVSAKYVSAKYVSDMSQVYPSDFEMAKEVGFIPSSSSHQQGHV
jgi:hypothetical protein